MNDSLFLMDTRLPLTLQPVSPKYVRLWTKFAEQAVQTATAERLSVVRDAFASFSWYSRAVQNISYMRSLLDAGRPDDMPYWLGSLAFSLSHAYDWHSDVLTGLQQFDADEMKRLMHEASCHLDLLSRSLEQVCQYTLFFCGLYGLRVHENTREVLAVRFPEWFQQVQQQTSPLLPQ